MHQAEGGCSGCKNSNLRVQPFRQMKVFNLCLNHWMNLGSFILHDLSDGPNFVVSFNKRLTGVHPLEDSLSSILLKHDASPSLIFLSTDVASSRTAILLSCLLIFAMKAILEPPHFSALHYLITNKEIQITSLWVLLYVRLSLIPVEL